MADRSQRVSRSVCVALMAGVRLLAGCHQQAGELFPVIEPAVVWPAPPEPPRIRLIGSMSGSRDLKAPRESSEVFAHALRGPTPPIRFNGPHGVACCSAEILAVADSSGAVVHILDLAQRSHTVTRGHADRPLRSPVGVAWAGDRLFVSDAQLHEIVELDVQGNLRGRFGADQLVRPVGIAYISHRQELCIVDGGAHGVRVYDLGGNLLRSFGGPGVGPGEFNYPTHVAIDRSGHLAVADTGNFRIQILDLEGNCLRILGRKGDGAGDFALPKGLGFDSDGHLYVVDAQFENFQIFDADGQLLLAVGEEGRAPGQFSLPAGLAVDSLDRIWVADSANRRLQVFQYLKPREVASPLTAAAEGSVRDEE